MNKYNKASIITIPSGYNTSTVFSQKPTNGDGDFAFTRATTATRVNADGLIQLVGTNRPRINFPLIDGVVQDSPALLLEPSRTNFITYSEDLTNGIWISGGSGRPTTIANQGDAPDGSNNADLVHGLSGNQLRFNFTYTAATHYISIYAKSDNPVNITLTDGIGGETFSITNKWKRYVFETVSDGSGSRCGISLVEDVLVSDNLLIWGVQLEQGTYTTSYIPTSGTTATRSADVCNGAGTIDEFNDSEGVLFAEVSAFSNANENRRLAISDGTSNNRVFFYYPTTGTSIAVLIVSGGVVQASISSANSLQTDNNKLALKYKANDISFWSNGYEIGSDNLADMPVGLSELAFDDGEGYNNLFGNAKQVAVFTEALTDLELESLTSWGSFIDLAQSQSYIRE